MENSLYFYLEPYVYLKNGTKGLLLVNLLDDKAFIFEDAKSIRIGQLLQYSPKRTIQITEDNKQIPVIACAIKNFMGDIIPTISQPLQFDSEINNISGKEGYMKSVIYSKYNIGKYISNCTIFADMTNQDCYDYINFITGIEEGYKKFSYDGQSKMNENDMDLYIKELVAINPNVTLNICGINITLLDYVLNKHPNVTINPVVSLQTIQLYPNILNRIKQKRLRYTLLLNLSHDNYDWNINDNLCSFGVKIANDSDLYVTNKLLDLGLPIKIFPVLTTTNCDFIKSLLSISHEELLSIKNKYRTIKINNLINSNFWGNLYLFPKGKVCYSLDNTHSIEINLLYKRFKSDFLNGSYAWTRSRNFSECSNCMFQYLCPAPNYIETHLRAKKIIKCLIPNQ